MIKYKAKITFFWLKSFNYFLKIVTHNFGLLSRDFDFSHIYDLVFCSSDLLSQDFDSISEFLI